MKFKYNLGTVKLGRPVKVGNDEFKDKARDLITGGLSWRKTAAKLNVSLSTIQRMMKAHSDSITDNNQSSTSIGADYGYPILIYVKVTKNHDKLVSETFAGPGLFQYLLFLCSISGFLFCFFVKKEYFSYLYLKIAFS